MNCHECARLQKKLRVLQSDFDFEFRKLSEDKSTEKALFEINAQKEVRKWQQKYTKERIDHEENSRKWLQKIDDVTAECQRRVKETSGKWQGLIDMVKQKAEKQMVEYKHTTETRHSAEIKKLTEKSHHQLASKEKYFQEKIEGLKQHHMTEVENLKTMNQERETKFKNQYESFILGLKSQKNVDERNYIKIQEQFRNERSKLIGEIYDLKSKIAHSHEKIHQLQKSIQEKDEIIIAKEQSIVQLTQSHEEKVNELKNQYQRELLDQEMKMEEKIKEFYENELKITEKYEQSLTKIEENRQVELNLYRHNMNEIKTCVQNRLSRFQDIEEIVLLKQKLAKKQKDCESLQRQLKDFQLQLQNKQDTYNKIFIPTINSTHLPNQNVIKRKQLKMKRPAGRSVTTVRQILNSVNINSNNLPLLNNLDKKMLLPPKSTKIL